MNQKLKFAYTFVVVVLACCVVALVMASAAGVWP